MGWLDKARKKLRDTRMPPPGLEGASLYEKQREIEKQNPDLSTSDRIKQAFSEEEGNVPGHEPAIWNEKNKKEKEDAARQASAEAAAAEAAATAKSKKAAEEKKKQNRLALMRRRGRRATILTGPEGLLGESGVLDRPMARSATLLGETV